MALPFWAIRNASLITRICRACSWFVAGCIVCVYSACYDSGDAQAAEQNIVGMAEKPFTAIPALDYPYARAKAWLEALRKAEKLLPSGTEAMLKRFYLDEKLARKALCALVYPVEVLTPAISQGKEIRVFLKPEINTAAKIEKLFRNRLPLLWQMCLVWEMEEGIKDTDKAWPRNASENLDKNPELEKLPGELDSLWELSQANIKNANQDEDGWFEADSFSGCSMKSVAGVLLAARERLRAGRPQAALDCIEKARELCKERAEGEITGPRSSLWQQLGARGYFLAGLCHMRLAQPALAEAAFSAAIRLLEGQKDYFLAELLTARGESRRKNTNIAGMCEDYSLACALGQCQGLSSARRAGECLK